MPYSRNLVMSADISGYSSGDDKRKERLQHDLLRLLDEAAQQSGLDRGTWHNQPKGDEVLSVVPDSSLEPTVVDRFVRELHAALYRLNQDRSDKGRVRLRVAMDSGVSYPTENGFGGPAVVTVTRLNGDAARHALRLRPHADLVLILSDGLYGDLVRPGHTSYRPELFEAVEVTDKEFHGTAWVSFVDHVGRSSVQVAADAPPTEGGGHQAVTNHVGQVTGDNIVFGFQTRG